MNDVFIGRDASTGRKTNAAPFLDTRTAGQKYQLQYAELKRVELDPRENGIMVNVAQDSVARSATS